jgi:hypothetical protein
LTSRITTTAARAAICNRGRSDGGTQRGREAL